MTTRMPRIELDCHSRDARRSAGETGGSRSSKKCEDGLGMSQSVKRLISQAIQNEAMFSAVKLAFGSSFVRLQIDSDEEFSQRQDRVAESALKMSRDKW